MNKDIFLSIIIPTYNEALHIESTLQDIFTFLSSKDFSYEIIVVDDGSKDDTVSFIAKKQFLFKNFSLLKNNENKGKGYSVKRGMQKAVGQARLFLDADHSVNISNLDIFLQNIKTNNRIDDIKADIVIASIELPGSLKKDHNHKYRRLFGKISKWIIRTFATPGIYDTQRGFKLFTKNAAEIIFEKQTIDRWGFDIELMVIAQNKKDIQLKIKELPVAWINSASSSVSLRSYLTTFIELIRIKINLKRGRYY